jgi:hypothetical protein
MTKTKHHGQKVLADFFFIFYFARYTGTPGMHVKWYSMQPV